MLQPPWPNDAQLAMSFVVNVEEGSEMSTARGDRGPEPVDELGVTLRKAIRHSYFEKTSDDFCAAFNHEISDSLLRQIAQEGIQIDPTCFVSGQANYPGS